MTKTLSGTPVSRSFVVCTASGDLVVQLTATRGQDIYSGELVDLSTDSATSVVTDQQLEQLKVAGRVERYNRTVVWVYGLAEIHHHAKSLSDHATRAYYLETHYPPTELDAIQARLDRLPRGIDAEASIRSNQVVIVQQSVLLFSALEQAEAVRKALAEFDPRFAAGLTVAFSEHDTATNALVRESAPTREESAFDALVHSQTDTTLTAGKTVLVLLCHEADEMTLTELGHELRMQMIFGNSGRDGLALLEELHPDLLITELKLPDMHAWELLSKVREIDSLRLLPVMVLADGTTMVDKLLALAVAEVDMFLVRPLSRARLRHNIWFAIKQRESGA